MVVRKVWSDSEDIEDIEIRRARARDLSRQFRGEKQIDWNVIENYVELLYPEDQSQRVAQLEQCRPLHVEAFGPTGAARRANRIRTGYRTRAARRSPSVLTGHSRLRGM